MEIYIFDIHGEELLTTVSSSSGLYSAIITEELNGISSEPLKVEVAADNYVYSKYLLVNNRIVLEDKDGLFREFVITEVDEFDDINGAVAELIAVPALYYELSKKVLADKRYRNRTADIALSDIVDGTRYDAVYNATTSENTTSFYQITGSEALAKLIEVWGGEYLDYVTLDSKGRIDGRFLELLDMRGSNKGARYVIDYNLVEIRRTVLADPITAAFGWGSSLEIEDEDGELTGGHSRYIDFADIEWKVSDGDPVDKPKGQKWVGDPDARNALGLNHNGSKIHLYGIFSNQNYEEADELLQATWEFIQENKVPKVNYVIKALELDTNASIGDTVVAIDKVFSNPIEVESRVIKVSYDLLDVLSTLEIEFGEDLNLNSLTKRVEDAEKRQEYTEFKSSQAVISANGKNMIYKGPNEPTGDNIREGDLWFREVDGEYTRTYIYEGGNWVVIMDIESEEIRQEAEAARDKADEAYDNANIATQNATTAINKAQEGFDKAVTVADDLTMLASFVDDNTDAITTISGDVEGLQTSVSNAEGDITTLQQTATSLGTRLTDAEGNLTTLASTVSGIQNTVSNVQGDLSVVTQLANTHQTKISNIEGDITTITQTANSLVSRVGVIEDWEIGGRNLILDSELEHTLKITDSNDAHYYDLSIDIEHLEGKKVSFSIEAKGVGGDVEFDMYPRQARGNSGFSIIKSFIALKDKWSRFEYTWEHNWSYSTPAKNIVIRVAKTSYDLLFKNAKLEKGNKATDWSPAPEDKADQSYVSTQISQLSTDINLRVTKNDVINQINLSTESILISGKKLILDGDTTVNGSFKVKNANIESLTGGKIIGGTIDAADIAGVNISGVNITGSQIRGSTIKGTNIYVDGDAPEFLYTNAVDVNPETSGTHVYIRPKEKDSNDNYGELRITTTGSTTSYQPVRTTGLISGHTNLYLSASEVRVVNSATGTWGSTHSYGLLRASSIKALRIDLSGHSSSASNFYIGTDNDGEVRVVRGDSTTEYRPIRAWDYLAPPNTNIHLRTDEEARVMSMGKTVYRGLRASKLYANELEINGGSILYLRSNNRVRVMNEGSSGSYSDLQARDIQARAIIANADMAGNNFYIGSDNEVRLTNISLGNVYRDLRANKVFANRMEVNDGNILYLQAIERVRVVKTGSTSTNYTEIQASNFIQSSSRELKDIHGDLQDGALEVLNDLNVVRFNYKDEPGIHRVGFIAEESSSISLDGGETVSTTDLIAYLTKGVQELSYFRSNDRKKLDILQDVIENLQQEVYNLKENA